MKNLNTILLLGGVGVLVYYMSRKSGATKSNSPTTSVGTTESGKTILEKLNYYFPQAKDVRVAKAIESQFTQDGKKLTDEQFLAKINASMKEANVTTDKQIQSEIDEMLKNVKTSQELDKLVTNPDERKISITKEQVQKVVDSKETLLMKSVLLSMIQASIFMAMFQSPSKETTPTPNKKGATTETEKFVGMSMF